MRYHLTNHNNKSEHTVSMKKIIETTAVLFGQTIPVQVTTRKVKGSDEQQALLVPIFNREKTRPVDNTDTRLCLGNLFGTDELSDKNLLTTIYQSVIRPAAIQASKGLVQIVKGPNGDPVVQFDSAKLEAAFVAALEPSVRTAKGALQKEQMEVAAELIALLQKGDDELTPEEVTTRNRLSARFTELKSQLED